MYLMKKTWRVQIVIRKLKIPFIPCWKQKFASLLCSHSWEPWCRDGVSLFMCTFPYFSARMCTSFSFTNMDHRVYTACTLPFPCNTLWPDISKFMIGNPALFLTTSQHSCMWTKCNEYNLPLLLCSIQTQNNWPQGILAPGNQAGLKANQPFFFSASWLFSDGRRNSYKLENQGQSFDSSQ